MTSNLMLASRREAGRSVLPERRLQQYHPRFQGSIRALAMRHSRIADLATSFPALLFALAVPRPGLDPARALARVIDGRPLADVAAATEVPLWLRRLPPEAFARPIARLPDGAVFRRQIANHFPRSPKLASKWLEVVSDVAGLAHESAAVWIAREFVREPQRVNQARLRLISLWAWFSCQPTTFGHRLIERPWTPAMHLDAAATAAKDWRTMIDLHVRLGDEPIADMWVQPGHMSGYDFVPLNSVSAITEESEAMRNCVKTYSNGVAHDRLRLWSVRRNGERVATLSLRRSASRLGDPLPSIDELECVENTAAAREVWWAARQWLQTHDLLRIDTEPRRWGTAPLHRSNWLSLWRPYWLVRRHIPEWLPIAPSRAALAAL